MSIESRAGSERAKSAIPVARPAQPRGAVQASAEPDQSPEEVLTPTKIKSWASSIGLHAVLLLIFAVWVFTPSRNDVHTFDTRLGMGGEAGGGDGMLAGLEELDKPITLAEQQVSNVETGLVAIAPDAALDPTAAVKVPVAENAGAAVSIPSPGGGGGGQGEGFGIAKFGNGSENIGGVGVKVGDPQFTLIWDSRADLDLHVIEPGGAEIYWEKPMGGKGGELDVDDVDGFGPENVYWVTGKGPPGEYRWFVHYYGGLGGINTASRWKVRVKHNGQVSVFTGKLNSIGSRGKIHSFTLDGPAGPSAADEEPASKR